MDLLSFSSGYSQSWKWHSASQPTAVLGNIYKQTVIPFYYCNFLGAVFHFTLISISLYQLPAIYSDRTSFQGGTNKTFRMENKYSINIYCVRL